MAMTETETVKQIREEYKYGFSNPDEAEAYFFKSGRGISHEVVEAIAEHKKEPDWMRKFRHKSLDYFLARPLPQWGGNLNEIDFENIYYYIRPTEKQAESWEDLPAEIKDTWDKLGIPEAEKKYLAGVGAQYESEVVYHKLQEDLTKQGVIFLDMDSGLREHEDIVKKDARCRYTTIQNWSNNVYNLVTKRAVAYEGATMEWVDGNLGSKLTMKYPAIWLLGERAHGEVLSIAFAGKGQHQDAGGKAVHVAPNTTSVITSKSISKNGGRAGYRGLLEVAKGARGSKSKVVCDALILDEESRSDTYPYMKIDENEVDIGHEATVSKIGEEQLFYLMSRGLSEPEASALIVSGFVEPITKELPLEYAVEMNRLIQLQMEGSVG